MYRYYLLQFSTTAGKNISVRIPCGKASIPDATAKAAAQSLIASQVIAIKKPNVSQLGHLVALTSLEYINVTKTAFAVS